MVQLTIDKVSPFVAEGGQGCLEKNCPFGVLLHFLTSFFFNLPEERFCFIPPHASPPPLCASKAAPDVWLLHFFLICNLKFLKQINKRSNYISWSEFKLKQDVKVNVFDLKVTIKTQNYVFTIFSFYYISDQTHI
jgi:hypothetical protein